MPARAGRSCRGRFAYSYDGIESGSRGSQGAGTTAGSAGDDDDGDGIPNDRDCGKRHGGDDDDSGSGSGSSHA